MSTQEANIDYRLYKKINEKPGSSIRELANEMGWSIVEVFKSVCRLESDNWIKSERDGNLVRITPVKWHEFLTPEEIEEFKNYFGDNYRITTSDSEKPKSMQNDKDQK